MKIKFIYTARECNQQIGIIVSARTETQAEADSLPYPASVYDSNNFGCGNFCAITDWIDVTPEELEAVFIRGEKTIDTNGCLCDVIDQHRNEQYLASLLESEGE